MIRRFWSSVLGKMMIRSLVVLSISIILIEYTAYQQSAKQIQLLTQQAQHQLTQVQAERFDQTVYKLQRDIEFVANLPAIQNFFLNRNFALYNEARESLQLAGEFLQRLQRQNPTYTRIEIQTAKRRKLFELTGGDIELPPLEELVPSGHENQPAEGPPSLVEIPWIPNKTNDLAYAYPIQIEGFILGYIEIHYDIAEFGRSLSHEVLEKSGHYLMVTQDNQILYDPRYPVGSQITHHWPESNQAFPQLWAGTTLEISEDGIPQVVSASAMKAKPWLVIAMVPRVEIMAGLNKTRTLMVYLIGINVLIEILLLFTFTQRIVIRPIRNLLSATRALRNRHFDYRIPVQSKDEFGELSKAFNFMAESIQKHELTQIEYQDKVRHLNEDLTHKVQELEQNISLKEEAEKQIRESEKRLLAIMDNTNSLISIKDCEGHFISINKPFAQILGVDRETIIGKQIGHFLPASYAKEIEANDQRVIKEDKLIELLEKLPHDSGERTYLTVKFPMRDEQGNLSGVCSLSTDITERLALEEQLRHAQKMEAVGKLAGGISHDFNNILAGIMGFAELIRMQANPQLLPYAENILAATKRASELTKQLLMFSRKSTLKMEPIHAHELIREVVNLLKRTLNPNIQIHQELKAQAQCVLGDSAQLHSVLLNLALNARDAMPKGGILSVSTSIVRLSTEEVKKLPFALAPGKFLKIEVKDTGTGIDPQIIDRIFDPFFTTKEVGKGTGLGLAAVYGTIQSHGGSLAVESVPNRGTAFNIFLPLTDRPTRIPLASAKGSHSGQGHVLLIEDDPLVQEMVCAVLENLGYRVSKASDGLAGVNLFKSNAQLFDLIVLDLIMPKMSGEDALKMIRQENPDIPILITSGYSEPLKSDLTLAHGVFFLKKPYDIATFSLRVKELVEVSQANHSA